MGVEKSVNALGSGGVDPFLVQQRYNVRVGIRRFNNQSVLRYSMPTLLSAKDHLEE